MEEDDHIQEKQEDESKDFYGENNTRKMLASYKCVIIISGGGEK